MPALLLAVHAWRLDGSMHIEGGTAIAYKAYKRDIEDTPDPEAH